MKFCNCLVLCFLVTSVAQAQVPEVFLRGDANQDSGVGLTDSVFISNFLFLGGPNPPCMDAADADGDGQINLTDVIFLNNHLFLGGPPPPFPYPFCDLEFVQISCFETACLDKFVRGDLSNNGTVDLQDRTLLEQYLFNNGPVICEDVADINDDGQVTFTDATHLTNFLFLGGPPPQPPWPNCGIDTTQDQFQSNCRNHLCNP